MYDNATLEQGHAAQQKKDQRIKWIQRTGRFLALTIAIIASAAAHFGGGSSLLYLVAIVALLATIPTFSYQRYHARKARKMNR